ncbi:MAG: flagellar FliJ family protein [Acidobacteria bacterium]|nr:flagellar FliJ family protein [Acidobacteriota bacterium]
MAAFKYRLQPLLEQKIRLQEAAEEEVKERKKELRAAEQRMEDLKRRVQELIAKREDLRRNIMVVAEGETLSGDLIKKRTEYVKAMAHDIDAAKDDVFSQKMVIDACQEKVDEAEKVLKERQKDVEILTKYREKLETRFRREEARKEELELDEIGSTLYTNKRRGQ